VHLEVLTYLINIGIGLREHAASLRDYCRMFPDNWYLGF
jgi:hypothetical protein